MAVIETQIAVLEGSGDTLPELLRDATKEGLEVQRATLRLIREKIEAEGLEVDIKLLRLGNETANALVRSALRAAEGEFQQRKAGALDELLAEIRAAKAARGMIEEDLQEIPE